MKRLFILCALSFVLFANVESQSIYSSGKNSDYVTTTILSDGNDGTVIEVTLNAYNMRLSQSPLVVRKYSMDEL